MKPFSQNTYPVQPPLPLPGRWIPLCHTLCLLPRVPAPQHPGPVLITARCHAVTCSDYAPQFSGSTMFLASSLHAAAMPHGCQVVFWGDTRCSTFLLCSGLAGMQNWKEVLICPGHSLRVHVLLALRTFPLEKLEASQLEAVGHWIPSLTLP